MQKSFSSSPDTIFDNLRRATKEHRMHTGTGHVELLAVANHSHNKGHEMHWTPKVLAREEDTTKRKIKEALAIKKLTNGQRRRRDHQPGLRHEDQQIVVRFSLFFYFFLFFILSF